MKRVTIVGGGFSGLTAAYYLARGGAEVTLVEKQQRLGGMVDNPGRGQCSRPVPPRLGHSHIGAPWPRPWIWGIPVVPTYHPAYLLRNPVQKRRVWQDIEMLLQLVGGSSGG